MKFVKALIALSLLGALAVGIAGCSVNSEADLNAQEKTSSVVEEKDEAINAVLVETAKLKPRTMRSYILLSATVETENMVDVYPEVAGVITKLNVEEGDRVGVKTTLIQLDNRQQILAEKKAEVNFKKSEANFQRVKESYEKNLISKVDFDNAQYDLESAQLSWNETKLNLSYTQVKSSISGVVAERLIREGDRVQPNTKLFRVVDTSEKIALVYIPEKEISSLQKGQKAILLSEFLGKKEFSGSVKRISPVVDPESGTFKVTISIDDPENKVRPGMFVSVRIITAVHKDIIAVPKDAIVYDAGLPFIFLVKENRAVKMPLQNGVSDERFVEALTGISLDDEVIVVGQNGLKNGSAVKVMTGGIN